MWPFDIFAKRREREERARREEEGRRLARVKESIEAENRRQKVRAVAVGQAQGHRSAAVLQQTTLSGTASRPSISACDDALSPLNPLSPFYQAGHNFAAAPAAEPRYSPQPSSHCGSSSSSHSHDYGSTSPNSDHSSSHSHSSHDHGCSSSSYDSGSSSYDSGSSSSSGDW